MTNDSDPKSRLKALVIDQSEEVRSAVSEILKDQFVVLEASNGIHGIDLTIDTEPDIVFIDIDLPDLNGFEVASRLQTLVPKTPLVALAEKVLFGTRDFGVAVGFHGYVTKPIDPNEIRNSTKDFLNGYKEEVENRDDYLIAFQSELAHRVEEKVRAHLEFEQRANYLIEQNTLMIELLQRRQLLLENAAHVSKAITSIFDIEELLDTAVDTICKSYKFYYAGIFLVDGDGKSAVLKSGYGEAGKAMVSQDHQLEIGGQSMIGDAIQSRSAKIALDVGKENVHFKNPNLPLTRSEMALPLISGEKVLGAISIQSKEENAFSEEDITAIQTLADQLAIAINNANLLRDLDAANQELLRTKTYEAIATATGEAIHWVGNKAAPIPASANRVREDTLNLIAMIKPLLSLPPEERQNHQFWGIVSQIFDELALRDINLDKMSSELQEISPNRLSALVGIESILEDLEIIENSANTILNIKEDLIGPARKLEPVEFHLPELLSKTVTEMGLPRGVIQTTFAPSLPPVKADPGQIERVFINLIKNAWEALDGQGAPQITLNVQSDPEQKWVITKVTDNGPGIPPEIQEKIWVSFFTTKKNQGGTGLGLSACMEIVNQFGGNIHLETASGDGTTFTVELPTARK